MIGLRVQDTELLFSREAVKNGSDKAWIAEQRLHQVAAPAPQIGVVRGAFGVDVEHDLMTGERFT
ncbi:hypothetical protein TUM22923_18190 [Polynucleobacter sp. TUM22923]|nr:hypothetical protein TUM22923_18190 [Polynucleobacter sp. TUM22923]